jgi:hypothetical protein
VSAVPLRGVVRVSVRSCGSLTRRGRRDVSGPLGVDQRLHDRAQQRERPLTVIGAAQRFDQIEQDRPIHWHRVKSSRGFLGCYSQSHTRWLLPARNRHDHEPKEPELHHPWGRSPKVACEARQRMRKGP